MAVEVQATRRRFTRKEYYRMAEVGILGERDHVELIEGEIIEMSPIGRHHKAFVYNLTRLLVLALGERATVSVQSPIPLSEDTEPEPDLTVLRRRDVSYKEREAWAEDALLVIEVAETSLGYDRTTKRRLYAPRRGFRSTGSSTVRPRPSRCIADPPRTATATSRSWPARRA